MHISRGGLSHVQAVNEVLRGTVMKNHDVSLHGPYVYGVLCLTNVICCVVDVHKLVMVDVIVFQK